MFLRLLILVFKTFGLMIAIISSMIIKTRMAPSPTGDMHVGSMAILLKNYAFAKKNGGTFVLRIEDTDKEREVPGGVERIFQVIHNYGLDWDEGPGKEGSAGPYIQSERLEIYQQHAQQLVTAGQAYHCFCSKERLLDLRERMKEAKLPPKYDRHCRSLSASEVAERLARGESSVIRLAVPDHQSIAFTDLIRGKIEFNSDEVDDQVLLKSDGYPTYHLGVVVDDHLMGITHIMRGEEWISSTPKHILLYQAFGWEPPIFAHIPVFLNPDGKGKMSKRKGTVSAQSFLDRGYLPEALLNFFMILGWTREDQVEIMTIDEYVRQFDPHDVSPKSVVFDLKKLDWINGIYIRQLPIMKLKAKLNPFVPSDFPIQKLDQVIPLISERLVKLADFEALTAFLYRPITVSWEELGKRSEPEQVKQQLQLTSDALASLSDWSDQAIEAIIRQLQLDHSWAKKQYFMMLRVALTGEKATPPLFATMAWMEKQLVLERINQAIKLC